MSGETEQAAEGLWSRFRDIALAMRRLEGFNFAAEGEGRFAERWLQALATDEAAAGDAARELTLRAFRAAADPTNFRILAALAGKEALALPELARATGLSRFALAERVNDLVQAGLAVQVLEQDAARPTPLADGLLGLVGAIERRLQARIRDGLPGLLGSTSEGGSAPLPMPPP